MNKKLIFVVLMGVCLFLVADNVNSFAFEKIKATQLPRDRFYPASVPFLPDGGFCTIQNDDGIPDWFAADFDSGVGIAVYMDPEKCETQTPCPFEITDAHFYLYGGFSDSVLWPVEIKLNIRGTIGEDNCNGPDTAILYSETFSIPSDSGYGQIGRAMNLSLNLPCCVWHPFFLEIVYASKTDPFHPYLPSLLMDQEVTSADTCNNWGLSEGTYYEWHDFWNPPCPGDAMICATGYTHAIEYDSCWYWKPDLPDQNYPAPSGMPDFGQYQFDDSLALCGPAAIANCLWWFNAVPPGMNPPDFIQLLSDYFHTHPDDGTYVDSIQSGLDRYFDEYGFYLCEHSYFQPEFFEIEDSLKKSQDIILLIGLWQFDPGELEWFRFGGHFVTMSGVCSESLWVALSDPARDAAEHGWPGRVRPAQHPSHPEGDALHNDPKYTSHDIYQATLESPSPGGLWALPDYYLNDEIIQFEGQNFQPGQEYLSYLPGEPVVAEIEYAIMILSYICGDCNLDGGVDLADVVYLVNYLFIGGPPPVPLQAGDVNTSGEVDLADVVYLVNYLFINGPPPCAGK